jgi:hypothetical protein
VTLTFPINGTATDYFGLTTFTAPIQLQVLVPCGYSITPHVHWIAETYAVVVPDLMRSSSAA